MDGPISSTRLARILELRKRKNSLYTLKRSISRLGVEISQDGFSYEVGIVKAFYKTEEHEVHKATALLLELYKDATYIFRQAMVEKISNEMAEIETELEKYIVD